MKRTILIILALFSFLSTFAQINEQNLSPLLSFDGEPYLAVNPADPDNIIAGWMRFRLDGRIWIAVRNSFDNGQTWGDYQFLPHTDIAYHSADVSIAFHHSGTAYLSYVDVDWSDTTAFVYVTKSIDGGNNWSGPVAVFQSSEVPDRPVDRPWITVDNSGTSSDGNVYVSSMSLYSHPYPHFVYIKYSIDGGISWSNISRVDNEYYPAGQLPLCYGSLSVDKHGSLYVAYYSYEPFISPFLRLIVARTDNVASGFNYAVVTLVFLTAADWTTYHNGYSLSANPLNSAVSIAWTDNRFGDYDILFSTSSNGGKNWNRPTRINDDSIDNGVLQDKVWTHYSHDGKLSIIWRDRRNGGVGDTAAADIYGVVSIDDGQSFSTNYRLSTTSAPYEPLPCCNSFISSTIFDTTLYAIWAEDRSTDWDVFFSRLNFGPTTGIGKSVNLSDNPSVNVFPNPVKGKVSIELFANKNENITITIYNLLGQKLISLQKHIMINDANNFDIDISSLITGTYVVIIKGNGLFAQRKFIVVR